MIKSIYLNLEDDVSKVSSRLKRESASEIVLVVPKKGMLFADSINLRLLKKQADLLGKTVSIMTMDELGQVYAKEAGFEIKYLTKVSGTKSSGDIRFSPRTESLKKPLMTKRPQVRSAEEKPSQTIKQVIKKVAPIIPAATVAIKDSIFPHTEEVKKHNLFQPQIAQELEPARRVTQVQKFVIGFTILSIIVIASLMFIFLPSAEINVFAKSQNVSRDVDVSVNTSSASPDQARLTLPATRVEKEFMVNNKFDTLGKKDVGTKAEGTVRIYNFTGKSLNLRAGTTKLLVGEKSYIFESDQNGIKPTTSASNSPNSGKIIAVEGGESSNLPTGTRLEITNQVFGNQPQVLYAVVDSPVIGGSSRLISTITQEDLNKAQESLKLQAIEMLKADLNQNGLLLPEKAFTLNATDFIASAQVGTETPTFTSSLKVAISGLAFNSEQLTIMMRERLLTTLGAEVNLQEASKDKLTFGIKDFDLATGFMRMTVHYESGAIASVDTNSIPAQIAGKSKEEASEVLLDNDAIAQVDIILSPSWQKKIPRFKQKINVILN